MPFKRHQSYSSRTLKTKQKNSALGVLFQKSRKIANINGKKTKTQEKKPTLGEQFLRCLQEVSQKNLRYVDLI